MTELFAGWIKKYPLMSIEDGLDQDAWSDWKEHTATLGKSAMLIGDDLFVTNPERLAKGIEDKQANSILIKLKSNRNFNRND